MYLTLKEWNARQLRPRNPETVRRWVRELKWHTEFGHLNRGDMLTSEQHRCSNEKKKF
ncbi:excisionase [Shigella flexneri]